MIPAPGPTLPANESQVPAWLTWLWLTVIAMHFPLLALLPSGLLLTGREDWILFPYSSLALVSFTVMLPGIGSGQGFRIRLQSAHGIALAAGAILLAINCGHFLAGREQRLEHLLAALVWLAVPLAAWRQGRRLMTLLPYCIVVLWLVNCLHGLWQLGWSHGPIFWRVGGLPGNRNWHGALLLATTPLAMWWAYQGLTSRQVSRKWRVAVLTTMGFCAGLLFYHAHSRGAWLSLLVVGFATIWMHLPRWRRGLAGVLLIGLFATGWLLFTQSDRVAELLSRDIRPPLWWAAASLTGEHPLAGVSVAGFENAFRAHLPAGYFLRAYATYRSNHPHNQFLFWAGAMGLPGLLALLALWVWPLWRLFFRYRTLSAILRLIGWGYLALLIHSAFDLVLAEWPTLDLAAVYLGLLWYAVTVLPAANSPPAPLPASSAFPHQWQEVIAYSSRVVLALCLAYLAYETVIQLRLSHWRHFTSLQLNENRLADAARGCTEELAVRTSAEPAFVLALLKLGHDPAAAWAALQRLYDTPDPDYSYSNRLRGIALAAMGRRDDAIVCLRRDLVFYPLSLITLSLLSRLEDDAGQTQAATATRARLVRALELKGLTAADLPAIFANPDYDLKFHRYKEQLQPADSTLTVPSDAL